MSGFWAALLGVASATLFAVSLLGQRWRDGRRSLWLSGPGVACGLVGVVGAALLVEGVPFMVWMAAIAAAGNVVLALAALGARHTADRDGSDVML